jgi:predicted RNase H-like HicB family nuclease
MSHEAASEPSGSADRSVSVLIVGKLDEGTGRWIAGSREFKVFSSGTTPQEAFDRAVEAVSLFLEQIVEMGTLDEVLREAGIRISGRPGSSTSLTSRLRSAIGGFFSFPASIPVPKVGHAVV